MADEHTDYALMNNEQIINGMPFYSVSFESEGTIKVMGRLAVSTAETIVK